MAMPVWRAGGASRRVIAGDHGACGASPVSVPARPDPDRRAHTRSRSRMAVAGRRPAGAMGGLVRARGFSLIEVMVAVALVALAGALAAGVLGNGFGRLEVRSAVQDVAGNLRHARALAIASGRPQSFEIDPDARTWRAGADRSGRLPERIEVVFTGAREVQPRPGEGAIVFFPDGASTGGRVALVSGSARWHVDVAWLTGEVRVHRGEVGP